MNRSGPNKTLDASGVRANHRRLLLQILWEQGRMSRADLARATGLSRSTITVITADLLRGDLVQELGAGSSRGGRRPVVLGFNHDARLAVGVDLGASHITVGLVNLKGEVLAERHRNHSVRDEPDSTMALVSRLIQDLLDEEPHAVDRVLGIGLGLPSPVLPDSPPRLSTVLMPRWDGVDVAAQLIGDFNLPVYMDNDGNLGALAEVRWGAAKGHRNVALVKLSTGVGLGLVIGGEIYRGAHGLAGEFSHVSVDANGPKCVCGQRGCLVLLAGSRFVVDRIRALCDSRGEEPPSMPNTSALVAVAQQGHPTTTEVIGEAGRWLGVGVTGLVNLFNPSIVVLGGALSRAGHALTEPIIEAVTNHTRWMGIPPVEIVPTRLDGQDVMIGAATLVFDNSLAGAGFIRPELMADQPHLQRR